MNIQKYNNLKFYISVITIYAFSLIIDIYNQFRFLNSNLFEYDWSVIMTLIPFFLIIIINTPIIYLGLGKLFLFILVTYIIYFISLGSLSLLGNFIILGAIIPSLIGTYLESLLIANLYNIKLDKFEPVLNIYLFRPYNLKLRIYKSVINISLIIFIFNIIIFFTLFYLGNSSYKYNLPVRLEGYILFIPLMILWQVIFIRTVIFKINEKYSTI